MTELRNYRSLVFDSRRWDGFELRPGDIIISTPPKSGTTMTQMMCALLVFDGSGSFPDSLEHISPWLDNTTRSMEYVAALYGSQQHRRFIKTHTPLDGLPWRDDITYLVVGRDPRDVMVSMEHHQENMNRENLLAARAAAVGNEDLATLPPPRVPSADPVERFWDFVEDDRPVETTFSLASVMNHLQTGWERRNEPNVHLFHYSDYMRDIVGELGRLDAVLGTQRPPDRLSELATETDIGRMRERAEDFAPNVSNRIWKDPARFFRAGGGGEWRARVDGAALDRYDGRVAELAAADLADWAHTPLP